MCLFVVFTAHAYAAWTTYTVQFLATYDWNNGQKMHELKVTGVSDAGASGDLTMSTGLATYHGSNMSENYMARIRGGVLHAVEYVPDGTATPDAGTTPVITLDTDSGSLFFSEEVTAGNVGQVFDGQVDTDFPMPIKDLIIASESLGNAKAATIYIWILR